MGFNQDWNMAVIWVFFTFNDYKKIQFASIEQEIGWKQQIDAIKK